MGKENPASLKMKEPGFWFLNRFFVMVFNNDLMYYNST